MYKGIKNLYLIKGKLVFRAHVRERGQEKYVWKTIGAPENFTDEELRKIVSDLLKKSDNIQKNRKLHPSPRQKQKKTKESQEPLRFPSLGEIITKFLEWYKETRRPASYERHKTSSLHVIRFFGEDTPIDQLNNGKIEAYKLWRKKQNVNPVTINKELRFISTLINKAVEFEWIPYHKLYKKPILIKGVDNKRLRYLTEDEEKRLLEAIKSPLVKDIVILALNTGLRKGEILSLKWSNVKVEMKCIILEPHETKNKRRHVIPLNCKAWEVIERRLKEKREDCPYVFHREGKKIKCIRGAFENALKRANIKDFRFHDLRHTFASRLVQKGVDIYVVKDLLNHSDITMTQRYAHLRLDNLKEAIERL